MRDWPAPSPNAAPPFEQRSSPRISHSTPEETGDDASGSGHAFDRDRPPEADATGRTDESGGTTDPGESGGAGRPSRPGWIATEGAEWTPDRQVLVSGGGVAGTLLAGLLRRAGYDPVLVGGENPFQQRASYLWPETLRLLDAAGVDGVRGSGTAFEGVTVGRTDGRTGSLTDAQRATVIEVGSERDRPFVVETDDLVRRIGGQLPGGKRRPERSVASISRRNDAFRVRFDDGIEEWFDVVVDAARGEWTRVEESCPRRTTTVRQRRIPVDTEGAHQDRILETWHDRAFVELIPHPAGDRSILRVTSPDTDVLSDAAIDRWCTALPGDLSAGAVSGPRGDGVTTVRQAEFQRARVTPDRWGADRVLSCGPSAFPVAPAGGLRTALAVEDAWVLADEFARGARTVAAAGDAYASRRSRRLTTLLRGSGELESDSTYPFPAATPPLSTVARLRVLSLAPVPGATGTNAGDDVFDRL